MLCNVDGVPIQISGTLRRSSHYFAEVCLGHRDLLIMCNCPASPILQSLYKSRLIYQHSFIFSETRFVSFQELCTNEGNLNAFNKVAQLIDMCMICKSFMNWV